MVAKQRERTFGARLSRRSALAALAGVAALPLVGRAQDADEAVIAEAPSFGVRRPGPVELAAAPLAKDVPQAKALVPVQMVVPNAGVDAPVETGTITPDGVMVDPSGPWVITWYDAIAAPGQGRNVVMAAHLDWWEVGPAVFWNVPSLPAGDLVSLSMEDGSHYDYAIEWSRLYHVATELTPEVIQTEVVGDTGRESLTMITCGGEFDPAAGEYLNRYVIRANKV
jgi:hypothetical protein